MAIIDLLVRGVDTDYGAGPDGNQNVGNQKGGVVSYTADAAMTLTGKQVPPVWCVIRVADLSVGQAVGYISTWRQALAFEWISRAPKQDRWDLIIRAIRHRISDGYGKVTEEQVDETLLDWNAIKISSVQNEIRARFVMKRTAWSPYALGGWNVAHSKFHEIDYDQETGRHDIRLRYDDQLVDDIEAARQISRYCEVLRRDLVRGELEYRVYSRGIPAPRPDGRAYAGDNMMGEITAQIQRQNERRIMLRRFRVDPVAVDEIIAGTHPQSTRPGMAEMDRNQLLGNIQDKLEL